jgi:hypothetical protein
MEKKAIFYYKHLVAILSTQITSIYCGTRKKLAHIFYGRNFF